MNTRKFHVVTRCPGCGARLRRKRFCCTPKPSGLRTAAVVRLVCLNRGVLQ